MGAKIKEYRGRDLSRFRTAHYAPHYSDITTAQEAVEALRKAEELNLKPFVLGAGSNVFFKNSTIKSYILRTAFAPAITDLGADLFEVSASVKMMDLLKRLYCEGRDAPYYLASAPCQIGGAIAMNAGTGIRENKAVFDFLKSVTYADKNGVHTKNKNELRHSYRNSEFSDKNVFIISAVFRFPPKVFSSDPIKERLLWAKENQDLGVPNCGSLCNKYDAKIMKFTRFIFSPFPAGMSKKKLNWTYNKAKSPFILRAFLWTLKSLHKLLGKEIKFEIKMVD